MREQGLRWHLMREIEERGAEAVIDQAIDEALDGPDAIYLSVDIDVVDPGMAPGTGTPEPGGMLPRELLRAVRRIVGKVELAGMDIVEVSPPYDWAESSRVIANRCALEAISALAVRAAPAEGPVRPRGEQGRRSAMLARDRHQRAPRRSPRRSRASTTSTSPRSRATSSCTSRWRSGPAGRSSSSRSGPGASRCRSRRPVPRRRRGSRSRDARPRPRARISGPHQRSASGWSSSRLTVGRRDDREVVPDGPYRLAILALNSILLLPGPDGSALRSPRWARSSPPGASRSSTRGCRPRRTSSASTGACRWSGGGTDPETGREVTKTVAAWYDPIRRLVTLTTIFEEGGEGPPRSAGRGRTRSAYRPSTSSWAMPRPPGSRSSASPATTPSGPSSRAATGSSCSPQAG